MVCPFHVVVHQVYCVFFFFRVNFNVEIIDFVMNGVLSSIGIDVHYLRYTIGAFGSVLHSGLVLGLVKCCFISYLMVQSYEKNPIYAHIFR